MSNIIPLSAEWYQIRSTLLTATDIAGAAGLSHYISPTHFLQWLRDGKPPKIIDHPEIVQAGLDNESRITSMFEQHTGYKTKEGVFIHNDWLGATPDRIIINNNICVELKLKYNSKTLPKLPDLEHIVQVHIQMFMTNTNHCYIVYTLHKNPSEYRIFKLSYSKLFVEWLLTRSYIMYCKWKSYPPPIDEDDWTISYYHEYNKHKNEIFKIDLIN